MKSATLLRKPHIAEGTFGTWQTDDGLLHFDSLELPWRDLNRDGIGDPRRSCITAGVYRCVWHHSPAKGWLYMLEHVEQRSDILIHPANFAGDVDQGWVSELLGCIALGYAVGKLQPDAEKHPGVRLQRALVRDGEGRGSRDACDALNAWGAREPFTLQIIEAG